jgi:hypothetical protein
LLQDFRVFLLELFELLLLLGQILVDGLCVVMVMVMVIIRIWPISRRRPVCSDFDGDSEDGDDDVGKYRY